MAALVVALAAPATALGQDGTDRAEALLEQGIAEADRGRWEAAEEEFRRAMEIAPTDRLRYHLARAVGEQGRVVEAVRHLRAIVGADHPDLLIADAARQELERLSARIGSLTVELSGATEGVTLLIDEQPAAIESARTGLAIDPGAHVVTVADERGMILARRQLDVADGASERVALHVAPAPWNAAQAGLSPDTVPDPRHEESAPITSQWWFWTGTGVIVLAAVVTAIALTAGGGDSVSSGDLDPIRIGGAGRNP